MLSSIVALILLLAVVSTGLIMIARGDQQEEPKSSQTLGS